MRYTSTANFAFSVATCSALLLGVSGAHAQQTAPQAGQVPVYSGFGATSAPTGLSQFGAPAATEKPSMADRVEATLSKNPVSWAWSVAKNRGAAKRAEKQAAAKLTAYGNDPISLNYPTPPANPELLISAAAASEQNGRIATAREQYLQALSLAPNHIGARLGAARLEDRQGNLKQAEQLYNQVVSLNPREAAAVNDLALCVARQGRLQESANLLNQAIRLQPGNKRFHNNLATVLVELNQYHDALKCLVDAHGATIANYNLGLMLSKKGRTQEAITFLQAAAADPNFAEARTALAALNAAPTTPVKVAENPAAQAKTSPQSGVPASSISYQPPAYTAGMPAQPVSASTATTVPQTAPVAPQSPLIRSLPPVAR